VNDLLLTLSFWFKVHGLDFTKISFHFILSSRSSLSDLKTCSLIRNVVQGFLSIACTQYAARKDWKKKVPSKCASMTPIRACHFGI